MAGSAALPQSAELRVMRAWYSLGRSSLRSVFTDMQAQQMTNYVEQVRRDMAKHNIDARLDSWFRTASIVSSGGCIS